MVKVVISSAANAQSIIEGHADDGKFCVISTTDPDCQLPAFSTEKFCRECEAILMVKFGDIDVTDDNSYPAITQSQAKLIANFVDTYDYVDVFYINCFAGICRSSAVAAAISLYINGDDKIIFNSPDYYPNMLVYRTLLEALGLSNRYD